jgi:hypothetical protein
MCADSREKARFADMPSATAGAIGSHGRYGSDVSGDQPWDSSLYFTDRAAAHVWRLPVHMDADTARPEIAW